MIMDEKNREDKIDLTDFDLSQFSEYFAEDDAKREAEQKAEAERLAKEEAEKAEKLRLQREAELKKAQEAEAERLAKEEAEKAARNAEREKEEAKRAAARAAEAALAAKKAQEAREAANLAASAKLRENASRDNSIIGSVKENTADFDEISSVLDFEEAVPEEEQTPEYMNEEISGKKKKGRSAIFTAIVIILALAVVASLIYALVKFSSTAAKPAEKPQEDAVAVDYKPYSDLETAYNKVSYPQGINESLKAMYSQNTDLAGWLTIDGMNIDYPIMQDKNNTHYLNYKNAFDQSARYGTPFLDFRCLKAGLSKNTVIYGHHMVNQEHFGSLDNFVNVDFYKKHPVIEYETLNGAYKFKIYAVFYATTEGSSDGGYVFEYYNPRMSDSNFDGYIKMLDQYALYTTEAGLRSTDKIITLSTCSHVYDSLKSGGVDARLVVVGRLLRNGEDESVNTENVTLNSNYRRPQIWYDKQKKTNPYESYRSWSPTA